MSVCIWELLAGETKRPYIPALQCVMHGCLKKASAMRPNAIFDLLHYGAKPQNYGLILACFSLSCYLGAVSLSCAAFHMESEIYAISSSPLKLHGPNWPITVPLWLLVALDDWSII